MFGLFLLCFKIIHIKFVSIWYFTDITLPTVNPTTISMLQIHHQDSCALSFQAIILVVISMNPASDRTTSPPSRGVHLPHDVVYSYRAVISIHASHHRGYHLLPDSSSDAGSTKPSSEHVPNVTSDRRIFICIREGAEQSGIEQRRTDGYMYTWDRRKACHF